MNIYNVINASPAKDGVQRYMVQGYPTGRTSCTVETESTDDKALAQSWADTMNTGKNPEGVRVSMYADD